MPPEQVLSVEAWVVMHRDLAQTARVRAVAEFLAELGPRLSRARGQNRPAAEDEWH